jgi:hypothetical protein
VSPQLARLHGRLRVLLAFHVELHAIGAAQERIDRNRDEIERVTAELADHRRECGDLTDATAGACS